MAQLVDLFVDIDFLLDVGIGARYIGLRLVVVVVADEILHGAFGEEVPELGAELCRQGLVVDQDQGGALHPLDDVGHGEGLAAAGHAEKGLLVIAVLKPLDEVFHRLGLVAGESEVGDDFERWHC